MLRKISSRFHKRGEIPLEDLPTWQQGKRYIIRAARGYDPTLRAAAVVTLDGRRMRLRFIDEQKGELETTVDDWILIDDWDRPLK
ncbi:MAG: hypothetical protein KIS92_04885 [Planctomycetota bacterium]|nr:hypothetical protein [Planctomycetota bacterium]